MASCFLGRCGGAVYPPPVKPLIILVPLLFVGSGVALFLLLPTLPLAVRVAMLVGEIVSAGVVGFLLWRRLR